MLHALKVEAYESEGNVMTAFQKDIGPVLSSDTIDYDEAILISKAADILRKKNSPMSHSFNRKFDDKYLNSSVPPKL